VWGAFSLPTIHSSNARLHGSPYKLPGVLVYSHFAGSETEAQKRKSLSEQTIGAR
jgi:hypothetical protein